MATKKVNKKITEKKQTQFVSVLNKESVNQTKKSKYSKTKRFILNYWMNNRNSYSSENQQDVINKATSKMIALGSSYGTNGFYIDITKKKTYNYSIEDKWYDYLKIKKRYVFYEEFRDGLGEIEIITDYPESIVPHKIVNGLIHSVRDKTNKVFEIYDGNNFKGETYIYDIPEIDTCSLIYMGNHYDRGIELSGCLVPEFYNKYHLGVSFILSTLKFLKCKISKDLAQKFSNYFSLNVAEIRPIFASVNAFIEVDNILPELNDLLVLAKALKRELGLDQSNNTAFIDFLKKVDTPDDKKTKDLFVKLEKEFKKD